MTRAGACIRNWIRSSNTSTGSRTCSLPTCRTGNPTYRGITVLHLAKILAMLGLRSYIQRSTGITRKLCTCNMNRLARLFCARLGSRFWRTSICLHLLDRRYVCIRFRLRRFLWFWLVRFGYGQLIRGFDEIDTDNL